MLVLMKTLHLAGLMIGSAGGMAGAMVAIQARRAETPTSPVLIALRNRFSILAFSGVLLLWATGLWLWIVDYDAEMLGVAFALKLIAATIILAIVVSARIAAARSTEGSPPPQWLQRVGPLSGVLTFVTVALAVYVFT